MLEQGFKDSPSETNKNHVSVGGVGCEDYSYAFYNPHNARFYFKYINNRGVGGGRLDSLRIINKVEFCADDFGSCRVVVKKNFIEVTNKIDKDRRFKIFGSADNRYDLCVEAVAVLMREASVVVKNFVSFYGLDSDCVCVKEWIPDNKILHDKIIDSVPSDITFRNDVVKKVYNTAPKNVEVSSPVQASNTFRNLALYDYAPMIASELESLRKDIMSSKPFVSSLESVQMDIKEFPDDVFKVREPIERLSDVDKSLLSFWLFDEFGGLK